jgi:acyl-coenzyme A synthetase/AMP-(fatty) acid ligase
MRERPGRDAPPNMTDYEQERARFRLEVPARFNYVLDVLERRAEQEPDVLALLSLDGNGEIACRHTFADLCRESRRMARAYAQLGVGKGDRVFVMLPRIPEWYVAMLGAIRIGAIPMPGTTLLTGRDIEYRITKAGASAVVTDADGAGKVEAVRDRLSNVHSLVVAGQSSGDGWRGLADLLDTARDGPTPTDPTASHDSMLLYFTSGTVAYPKMVLHTQASYGIGHTITARYWQDLKPGDVHWTISDTGWAKAAGGKLFGQWTIGATVVQMEMGKPTPDLILSAIARHGVTTFCAPPTIPWRDADGYLWFVGRDDDVITSAAYRIGPFEVESALIEHTAVAEAAVVGKPDAQRTEIVTAFVVLTAGHTASEALKVELQEHVKAVTAAYKYPREIHFVEELPKTVSGKIRRTELRGWLSEGRV